MISEIAAWKNTGSRWNSDELIKVQIFTATIPTWSHYALQIWDQEWPTLHNLAAIKTFHSMS